MHVALVGPAPDRLITYKDRQGDRYVAVVLDIHTGMKRIFRTPLVGSRAMVARRSA